MPETSPVSNPFREEPAGLNPNNKEFFETFVPDYEPDELTSLDQPKQEQEPESSKDQLGPTATAAEKEAYENTIVECAGIEITRREARQIEEIVQKLNKERKLNELEPVELGKEIKLYKIEIGGKTKAQLEEELKQANIQISNHAQSMLDCPDFTTKENKENQILIRLKVSDLGFSRGVTTEEIFNKAIELGMDLCPPETGPQFRLQNQNLPPNEWVRIGMKAIGDADRHLSIFRLEQDGNGQWLHRFYGGPNFLLSPENLFVFRLPRRSFDA